MVAHSAPPSQAQTPESYAGAPEWYGRFAAVKEISGTFTISFDFSATSDPDGNYKIWQGNERWSISGTLRAKQTPDNPIRWLGDGEASMEVTLDTLTGVRTDVVYRDSIRGSGRVRMAQPDFPVQLGITTTGYVIQFGMPELTGREHWARLDTGETQLATPRLAIFASVENVPLPERGQRLRGRQEISLSDRGRISMTPFDWIAWVRLWPLDEARAPKAVVTWDLAPVVHEYKLEVEIPGYADWYPQAGLDERAPGADLTARARLVESGGATATAGVVKTYLFELDDVSREPGVAMNWPPPARATRDLDLRFDHDRNFEIPNWVSSDERSVEVRGDIEQPEVVLTSYDWGANGFLRVSAELQDGRTVYGELKEAPGQLRIPIPKRRDGSRIAERYRARIGERNDDADDEEKPRPEGTRGDGLSVYQEYRGFYENGEHVRGDLERKDLFVYLGPGFGGFAEPGIQMFTRGTGLAVHAKLSEQELGDDEVINPNQSAAVTPRQHGLRVVREDIEPAGRANPRNPNATVMRSPGEVDHISIDTDLAPRTLRRNGSLQVNADFTRVVAHELGHGVGMRHHGTGDVKHVVWTAGANGGLIENGSPIQLRRENGTPARFPSLAPGGSMTVWLGAHGGEHSGDQGCFMRYVSSNAYRSDAQGNLRYWADPPEPFGSGVCTANTGTGVNQPGRTTPQPRYGNASAGDCQLQLRVRDE